jgi:hypothetical protein
MSVDPMSNEYPDISPYAVSLNNPIENMDPNGMWVEKTVVRKDKNGNIIKKGHFWVKAKTFEITYTIHNVKVYNGSSYSSEKIDLNEMKTELESSISGIASIKGKEYIVKTKVEGEIKLVESLDEVQTGKKPDEILVFADPGDMKKLAESRRAGAVTMGTKIVLNAFYVLTARWGSKNTLSHEYIHRLGRETHNRDSKSLFYIYGMPGQTLLDSDIELARYSNPSNRLKKFSGFKKFFKKVEEEKSKKTKIEGVDYIEPPQNNGSA